MAGHEWWCDQGVIRDDVKGMFLSVAWRNVRDEWMKEMHEKPKLSIIKKCEV